jgi:hypothetical protein
MKMSFQLIEKLLEKYDMKDGNESNILSDTIKRVMDIVIGHSL